MPTNMLAVERRTICWDGVLTAKQKSNIVDITARLDYTDSL
jgi:hypothetical protein